MHCWSGSSWVLPSGWVDLCLNVQVLIPGCCQTWTCPNPLDLPWEGAVEPLCLHLLNKTFKFDKQACCVLNICIFTEVVGLIINGHALCIDICMCSDDVGHVKRSLNYLLGCSVMDTHPFLQETHWAKFQVGAERPCSLV